MQPNAYRALAQSEQEGWYYQARARAVTTLVREFIPHSAELKILDVGCGTGGTSHAFEQLGQVTGLEPSALAMDLLRARYPELLAIRGTVEEIPNLFAPVSFDLATIMGVLYHANVVEPVEALRNIRQSLKPSGWIVWNEAVYPFLKRRHDVFVHTGRRFYPRQMHRALEDAGFEVLFGSHLLSWAFPIGLGLAAAYRARSFLSRAMPRKLVGDPADDRLLPTTLSNILRALTYWEWYFSLKVARLPVGISYLVIARNGVQQRADSRPDRSRAA